MSSSALWSSIASTSANLFCQFRNRFGLPSTSPSSFVPSRVAPRLILPRLSLDDELLSRRLRHMSVPTSCLTTRLRDALVQVEDMIENAFDDAVKALIASFVNASPQSPGLNTYLALLSEKYRQLYHAHVDRLLASATLLETPKTGQDASTPKLAGRQGRPRVFTKHQTSVLYELLQYDDKLTLSEKTLVAERLALTKDQVNRWFCNARARRLNKKRQKTHQVTEYDDDPITNFDQHKTPALEINLLDPRLRSEDRDSSSSGSTFFDQRDLSPASSAFANHSTLSTTLERTCRPPANDSSPKIPHDPKPSDCYTSPSTTTCALLFPPADPFPVQTWGPIPMTRTSSSSPPSPPLLLSSPSSGAMTLTSAASQTLTESLHLLCSPLDDTDSDSSVSMYSHLNTSPSSSVTDSSEFAIADMLYLDQLFPSW